MWTEGADTPAVPGFKTAAEAQTYHVLTEIERHTRTIKGWVVLFGTLWVLGVAVIFLAILANGMRY